MSLLTILDRNAILIILTSFSLNAPLAKFCFPTWRILCWISSHISKTIYVLYSHGSTYYESDNTVSHHRPVKWGSPLIFEILIRVWLKNLKKKSKNWSANRIKKNKTSFPDVELKKNWILTIFKGFIRYGPSNNVLQVSSLRLPRKW